VKKVEGTPGNFNVTVQKAPRFIDAAKCTACGDCAEVCPVDLPNEYDQGLSQKHAIFKKYAQAIPSAFAIAKRDTAPCKATCPAHVSVQGYIALIKQKNTVKRWRCSKMHILSPESAAGSAIIPVKGFVPERIWIDHWPSNISIDFWPTWTFQMKRPTYRKKWNSGRTMWR
jgi:ferredoxin